MTLPSKTDGSLGRVKVDKPGSPTPNLAYQVPASELEALKSAVIAARVTVHEVAVSATPPTAGQVLTATSDVAAGWATPSTVAAVHDTAIDAGDSPYSINAAVDEIIRVTSGEVHIQLPDPACRRMFMISKAHGGTDLIYIDRFGAETIQGFDIASADLPGAASTECPSWTVWSSGTGWWIA